MNGKSGLIRLGLASLEDRVVLDGTSSFLGSSASQTPLLVNPDVFTGGVLVAAGDVTGDGYVDIVTGAGPGGGPHVRVFDGKSGQVAWEFMAYDPNFRGGVSVAVGDVNGDGRLDIVTGAGPGGGPHIKVFDSVSRNESFGFFAFEPGFSGGTRVAVGDTDGDGKAEIAVAGGIGGTAEILLFEGTSGKLRTSVPTTISQDGTGATVAFGDFNRDGKADLVVGSGGGPSRVQVYDLNSSTQPIIDLVPYDPGFTGSVWVAAGDTTGDGVADIITGAGLGGGPHVRIFDGKSKAEAGSLMAYSLDFRGGITVTVADLNADGQLDVITGAGPGGGPHVRMFSGSNRVDSGSFFAYAPLSPLNGFSREVTSNSTNALPTISDVADQSSRGEIVGPLTFTVGDSETPANNLLVMATSSNPALLVGIVVDGIGANRTLTLTPTPGLSGTSTITITVTDGNGKTVSDQLLLTVTLPVAPPPPPATNTPPTISNLMDQTSDGRVVGPLTFTVGDNETAAAELTVSASSGTIGLANILLGGSGSNRTVTLTPQAGRTGTSTITITVTDGNGATVSEQFQLIVTATVVPPPINTAPTISDVFNQTSRGEVVGPLAFTIGDAETSLDNLVVTATSDNVSVLSGIAVGGTGANRTVTLTPTSGLSGFTTITLTVIDANGTSSSDRFQLTVTQPIVPPPPPTPINTAPTISDVLDQTSRGEIVGPLAFTIGDAETSLDNLVVTATSDNASLLSSIVVSGSGANRTVTLTPATGLSGVCTITLTVIDAAGASTTDRFLLSVTSPIVPPPPPPPPPINTAPTISDVLDQTSDGQVIGPLAFTISDAETTASALSVSVASGASDFVDLVLGGTGTTRTITLTPRPNVSGMSTIRLTVVDADGAIATDEFILTVMPSVPPPPPPNTPPTISDVANQTSDGNAIGPLTFTVGDVETPANDLVVSATSSVPGLANIVLAGSGSSRTITATPVSGQTGTSTITVTVTDGNSSTASDQFLLTITPPIEPQPDLVSLADFNAAISFLYTGPNAIQTGVAPGAIDPARAAVIRGRVQATDGSPLSGVALTVLGHSEFGQSQSRADGTFDLVVNGGGQLNVVYTKTGFLPVQRSETIPIRDFALLPTVALTALDTEVTAIDLTNVSTPIQVARGSVETDVDGSRQTTLLFPQGLQATMTLPGGATQPIANINVRATEYTVGNSGPMAMPGTLPATSGYTYAVELSVDEALAAGATRVDFTQPVPVYVENFLNFPVGMAVPSGYFDREQGQWIASDNGKVIKVLSETATDVVLDTDGDGFGDSDSMLAALGITASERGKLVELYNPGQSIWRTPVTHFSVYDFNWPFGPPDGATDPDTNPDGLQNGSVTNPNSCKGSIIEMENQVLRETIPVSGTPFSLNYSSARTIGNQADRTRIIQLSDATLPANVLRIDLSIKVAGREFTSTFASAPNVSTTFTWDGKDAYGRFVTTSTNAVVDIAYVYAGQYRSPVESARIFGTTGNSAITGSRTRQEISLHQTINTRFGTETALPLGLGGTTLSVVHTYDPISQDVALGDGSVQRASDTLQSTVRLAAGNGQTAFQGDGGMASAASFSEIGGVAAMPDGSVLIADSNNFRIRKVSASGIITTFAGKGIQAPGGTIGIINGNAASAEYLGNPVGVAYGPDGSVYFSEFFDNRVRHVTPDGRIFVIVGDGPNGSQGGSSGDGGSSNAARVRYPSSLAVGGDGSLYIADTGNFKIRRVGTDGIITTILGNGTARFSGDGGLAANAGIDRPSAVSVGPDGSVYVGDSSRIRRISTDGIIRTVVGTGAGGFSGDGGLATQAQLFAATSISVTRDGVIYFTDTQYNRVRRVGTDGIITTIAGNGSNAGAGITFNDEGGIALQATLANPVGVTTGPTGRVFIANAKRVYAVSPALANADFGDQFVPSKDGRELYRFAGNGRHLQTLDALTQTPLYSFAYDAVGRLTSVTDNTGNITSIERDSDGKPTAIVAPFGQRTALQTNINGYLSSVANPASESHTLGYALGGLLNSFTDPRGNTSTMTYDSKGRLVRDADPINGFTELTRTELGNGSYRVSSVNAVNGTRGYIVELLPDGSRRRTSIDGRGFATVTLTGVDGTERTTSPDGTIASTVFGPDPRFGMLAPVVTKQTVTTPSGITSTVTGSRAAVFSIPGDRTSPITSLTTTAVVNGRTFTSVYDAPAHTILSTSAAGREATTLLDSLGRTSRVTLPEIEPTNYTYDARGRIDTISQAGRIVRNSYDAAGRLATITDPLGRVTRFEYDAADRITKQTQPDSTFILFRYDIAGNLVGLTPPGQPEHVFTYNNRDQVSSETPPPVGATDDSTRYVYNAARQLVQQALPGGQIISYAYCDCGRLTGTTTPWGQYDYIYSTTTGELSSIASPGGFSVSFGLDGGLVTSETTTGPISGRIDRTFDSNFRVVGESVNGANGVTFGYDADGLLTQAGALTLYRSSNLGRIDSTYIGSGTVGVAEVIDYNNFGEVRGYSATWNAQPRLAFDYTRDALGRITRKIDIVNGTGKTIDYGYDLNGQLISVTENGLVTQRYAYDPNGNRLSLTTPTGTVSGVYNAQDQLLSYGTKSYTYDELGSLKQVTDTATGQITRYQYDAFKNLTRVELPDGKVIEYLIDGQNRRVGKKVNGVLFEGLVYNGQLRPVAKLDGSGNILERFVYSTGINVPAYMVKDGVNYRLITDHLGSVRMVINVQTGAVVQRLDYDAFGRVTLDTNAGFQPFGFAGGLYDADTGLVRFGARDYDAESGRWTAKDPIGFSSGDTNSYAYVRSRVTSSADPTGLYAYPWELGPAGDQTAESVAAEFMTNPNNYFPFDVGGDNSIRLGQTYQLSGVYAAPFNMGQSLPAVGGWNVIVTSQSRTGFTFTTCPGTDKYTGPGAGSTISFEITQRDGKLYLTQTGRSSGGGEATFLDRNGAYPSWFWQAQNLRFWVNTR